MYIFERYFLQGLQHKKQEKYHMRDQFSELEITLRYCFLLPDQRLLFCS